MRHFISAALAACFFVVAAPALAKPVSGVSSECNVTMPCDFSGYSKAVRPRAAVKKVRIARHSHRRWAAPVAARNDRAFRRRTFKMARKPIVREKLARRTVRGTSTAGIVAPLAAKVAEIGTACGSTVISGVRHTRVAGSGRISLHSSGRAVDMRGNPSCIYAHLHGWPGGYTTDYGRMAHIHISYDPGGGREMGLRFAHGGGKYRARRLARRAARYASVHQ